jgi:hypothetical protein
MLARKVLGIVFIGSTAVTAFSYNPFTTSVYLNEALGNPSVTTRIDSGSVTRVGFDGLKLLLKPSSSSSSYYFEPFAGLSTMAIEDPITSEATLRDFFCVELERDLYDGSSVYKKYDAMGKIGWLVNQVNGANSSDATSMAGLQLAIWEVAYDGTNGNTYDLGNGIFRTDSLFDSFTEQAAARAAAESWLTMLTEKGDSQGYFYYHSPGSSTNKADWQDLVSAAPEPSTLAAIAIGAACLLRRRKKA